MYVHHNEKTLFLGTKFAKDVYTAIEESGLCAKKLLQLEHRRRIKLFPATGPQEFVAINIQGPLPETLSHYQLVVIMTYKDLKTYLRYSHCKDHIYESHDYGS